MKPGELFGQDDAVFVTAKAITSVDVSLCNVYNGKRVVHLDAIKRVRLPAPRRLLRWHWEHKPGSHSLGALLDHIAQRRQESPEYYDRMPDLSGKNSWQQLDTTVCMRVLLDPETDVDKPLDLLGNTEHPGAARRACNAVRTARNEAAHAADRTDAAQAAILFNEAIESLEEGYAGTALRENELARYYRQAEEYLARCGAKEPVASARPAADEEKPARSPQRTAGRTSRSGSRTRSEGSAKGGTRPKNGTGRKRAADQKKARRAKENKTVLAVVLVVVALGLLARAFAMGLV